MEPADGTKCYQPDPRRQGGGRRVRGLPFTLNNRALKKGEMSCALCGSSHRLSLSVSRPQHQPSNRSIRIRGSKSNKSLPSTTTLGTNMTQPGLPLFTRKTVLLFRRVHRWSSTDNKI